MQLNYKVKRLLEIKKFESMFNNQEFSIKVSLNSQGLRDTYHPFKKSNGIFRIVTIGDSMTFGIGVNLDDSYPKVFEKILNLEDKTRHYEVINISSLGVGPVQYVDYLNSIGYRFHPDLVIIEFSVDNDIFDASSAREITNPLLYKIYTFLIHHSYLFCFLKSKISLIRDKFIIYSTLKKILNKREDIFSDTHLKDLAKKAGVNINVLKQRINHIDPEILSKARQDPIVLWKTEIALMFPDINIKAFSPNKVFPENGWRKTKRSLRRIKETCDKMGAKLLLVVIPSRHQISSIYWRESEKYGFRFTNQCLQRCKAQKLLEDFCKKHAIEFLDLYYVIKEKKEQNLYYPIDGHLTKNGYHLVAKEIAKKVLTIVTES